MKKNRKLGAIILAAGRGKRMEQKRANKVTLLLRDKPLITYAVNLLEKMKISPVIVVVGHAKDTVQVALKNARVVFAEQKRRLGTGHAVRSAITKIPSEITDIIILYGDDSFVYNEEILNKIINIHIMNDQMLTFLTIKVNNPAGLGRIIRNDKREVIDIIEDKDATVVQKKIKEINPNCYIFQTEFLKKYLPKITKSPVTGEYYLPALIKLARDYKEKLEVVEAGFIPWQGVNTQEDLIEAKKLFKYE